MDCFIDDSIVPNVCAWSKAQTTNKPSTEVRNDVAIEVRRNQNIKLRWACHKLHAERVNNDGVCLNCGIFFSNFLENFEKHAIRHLHNVGFMNTCNFLSPFFFCIFKGKMRNLFAGSTRYQLDAESSVFVHHIFDAFIKVFSVLANNHEVNVIITGLHALQRMHRTQICKSFKMLAKLHIN